jgi:hypothetical protein
MIRRHESTGATPAAPQPSKVVRESIAAAIRDLSSPSSDLLTKAVARQFLKLHGVQQGTEGVKHAG